MPAEGKHDMTDQPSSDALVVFGAAGDLAHKQIYPALQALARRGLLQVPVIGMARAGWTDAKLRERVRDSLEKHGGVDAAAFDKLASLLHSVNGDYGDERTYATLARTLGSAKHPLHYLAIPPSAFSQVIACLARARCTQGARVAVEKPFGRDLASAQALNRTLRETFPESSIFRIDHYLGKEAVQSLLYFRFANSFLEPLWNRHYIRNVQITMAEKIGLEGRGKFYEETGAIRDVIQNHLLQVTAILAMDAPVGRDLEAVRDERSRLLRAIEPLDPANVVRGQFRGYRDEHGVARDSNVETFAAVRLKIESSTWAGVPFLVRSGKCLPLTATEVLVQLKEPPRSVFGEGLGCANYFRFRLSPEVSSALGMRVKRAGEAMEGRDAELFASVQEAGQMLPYERLLGDAMRGDASLFAREDAVEAQWRVVDPILRSATPPSVYEPGSWGPVEADRLVRAEHCGWHDPKPGARV